jgi:hypothetical protein
LTAALDVVPKKDAIRRGVGVFYTDVKKHVKGKKGHRPRHLDMTIFILMKSKKNSLPGAKNSLPDYMRSQAFKGKNFYYPS